MSQVSQLIEAIERGKGAKFASFTYRSKGTNELSKITVILGASTEELYKKDVILLQMMLDSNELKGLWLEAVKKIMESRQTSLIEGIGNNPAYTCKDCYVYPVGLLNGIHIHKETGEVYVTGLVTHKTVLESGEFKTVNHRPLTLAKKEVEAQLPSNKFRRYILPRVVKATLNGETLEFETEFN